MCSGWRKGCELLVQFARVERGRDGSAVRFGSVGGGGRGDVDRSRCVRVDGWSGHANGEGSGAQRFLRLELLGDAFEMDAALLGECRVAVV